MTNGPMLKAAAKWLKISFAEMMQQVWLEFPQQKIVSHKNNPIMFSNYLVLSKQEKFKTYFYTANKALLDYTKRNTFYSIYVYAR